MGNETHKCGILMASILTIVDAQIDSGCSSQKQRNQANHIQPKLAAIR